MLVIAMIRVGSSLRARRVDLDQRQRLWAWRPELRSWNHVLEIGTLDDRVWTLRAAVMDLEVGVDWNARTA